MENFTPVYDNTMAAGFFPIEEQQPVLSDKEKNQLLQVLTNSLDLQELGAIVMAELKQKLNASFCKIVSHAGQFQFGNRNNKTIVKSFDLTQGQDGTMRIEYGFLQGLSLRENQLLKELTHCIRNPIRNALQFFQLQKLALKDELTSLGNRRQFDETLEKTISTAQRNGESVAMMVLDLDKFKPVNDKHGHAEGDKVLMQVADAISRSLRSSDHAFRFGGDEFCCITSNTNKQANELIVKRIQKAIAADPLLQKHGVSASFGMAMLDLQDDVGAFFNRADEALYQAKQQGRNLAVWAA